jgi:hypothetical protein
MTENKKIYFTCWNCGGCHDSTNIPFNPQAKDQSVKCHCGGYIVSPSGKVSMGAFDFDVLASKIKNPDIKDCKLIKDNKNELGTPKVYKDGLCEGYTNGCEEPHEVCRKCKTYVGYEYEYQEE